MATAAPATTSNSRLFPLSLSVRESQRDTPTPIPSTSTATTTLAASAPTLGNAPSSSRQRDLLALRDSNQTKKEYEAVTERWSDLLMESKSVDKELLRRAAQHLQPMHYQSITHERHLTSFCSYPLCPNPPSRPFSSAPRYILHRPKGGRGRDVIQVTENETAGFCSGRCRARSTWFERTLSLEPVWARQGVATSSGSTAVQEAGVTMLEDMEEKGQVTVSAKGEITIANVTKEKGQAPKVVAATMDGRDQSVAPTAEEESTPRPVTTGSAPASTIPEPRTVPRPQPQPQPQAQSSRPPPTRLSDSAVTSFAQPLLSSLRIIERPTPTSSSVPEAPSIDKAAAFKDDIALRSQRDWGGTSSAAAMATVKKPSPPVQEKKKAKGIATDRKKLEAARRNYDSTSMISSSAAVLGGLPADVENVGALSMMVGQVSKEGAGAAKLRAEMEGAKRHGLAGAEEEETMHDDDEEEEEEESEDEDVKLAFEQAALAQQQLTDGTFH